jgi:phage gp29-like protein
MVNTSQKTSILGPDGQPIQSAILSEEVAAPELFGVRRIGMESVASGLTPLGLAQIMQAANAGNPRAFLTLAMEMEERYLHYASQLQTRRLAFDAIPCTVLAPKGVNPKIVDAVTELTNRPGFRECCSQLSDAIAKGYSVVEILWDYTQKVLQPVSYKWRDQRFFQFDVVAHHELRLIEMGSLNGSELPKAKFIANIPNTRTGIPIRRGLARPAAWAFLIQSMGLQDWASFAEIYGIPFRLGKYHTSATETDKRALLRAVRDIANDAAGIIPQGMEIEFIEAKGTQGAQVFGELLNYVDKQISKLVLGQTMTSDDGSSLGQAKIHNEVRLDILRSDCVQMATTINRDLIEWFVALNFGPQDVYPTVHFQVAEPEDIRALSHALALIVPLGLKVSQNQVREKLGLSKPSEDDEGDVLVAPASSGGTSKVPASDAGAERSDLTAKSALQKSVLHVRGCACANCKPLMLGASAQDEVLEPDETDLVQAGVLSDWEELVDPMLQSLQVAANNATSYEQLIASLDKIKFDSSKLQNAVAKSNSIARGLGDVDL